MRWERAGFLHPQYAHRGLSGRMVTIYDPDELARVPQKYRRGGAAGLPTQPGELAARAAEMFSDGKSDHEIVIELRETFPKIAELREQWLDAGGAHLTISRAAHAELVQILGPFSTVADLIERIRDRFVTIEAKVPEGASDPQIEHAIHQALDAAGAPR